MLLVGSFFGARGQVSSDDQSIEDVFSLLVCRYRPKGRSLVENLTMADRKKVEIVRASSTSHLLLLDEVMAGLDPDRTGGYDGNHSGDQ